MSRITSRLEDQWIYKAAAFFTMGSKEYLDAWSSVYCAAKIQACNLVDLDNRILNLVFNLMVLQKGAEFKEQTSKSIATGATTVLNMGADNLLGNGLKVASAGLAYTVGMDPNLSESIATYTIKPIVQDAVKHHKSHLSRTAVGYLGHFAKQLGLDNFLNPTSLAHAEIFVTKMEQEGQLNESINEFRQDLMDCSQLNLNQYSINPFKVGFLSSIANVIIRISLLVPYILGKVDGWFCYFNDESDFLEDAINLKLDPNERIYFDKLESHLSLEDITKERYHSCLATGINGVNVLKNGAMSAKKTVLGIFY